MKRQQRQRGMTLLTALIMLIVLTMLALTSFNLSKSNLQIVSNMQQRDESAAAANQVIEEIISNSDFTDDPDKTIQTPCNNKENTRCIDTNADKVTDVTVTLISPPKCVKAKIVKSVDVDVSKKSEQGCLLGGTDQHGMGADTGDSLCADSVWEVQAEAVDDDTAAKVIVTQGMEVRVKTTDVIDSCKS